MLEDNSAPYRVQETDRSRQQAAIAVLAKVIILTNLFVTILLTVGMIIDHHSVTLSFVIGIGYFTVTTPIVVSIIVIVLSGTLSEIGCEYLRQRTAQKQIERTYQIQRLEIIDVDAENYRVSAPPVQLPWTRNFVPATPHPPLSDAYHE